MLEKVLSPFGLSFGRLQDLATLLKRLNEVGITTNEVIDYVERLKQKHFELIKEDKKRTERWNKLALYCSICNTQMRLLPVNTNKANQTGDDSNSVWICPNKECMETVYVTEATKEIMKGIR